MKVIRQGTGEMSGYLVQSRKHVTVLAAGVGRCSDTVQKGGSCTDYSDAGIATSIDDDALALDATV
jgi:hypothetical protein